MKYLILIALIMSQSIPTNAQQREPRQESLDGLILEALANNPLIGSFEEQQRAVSQRVTQVSSLDDPMLTFTHWFSNVETRVGPMQNAFMLTQRLPFFGKLRLRREMAEKDMEVADQMLSANRRDVIYKIKLTYFDLYWLDQSLQILGEYESLLQRFREVALIKYGTGDGIQANVLKAQVEISSIEEQRLRFTEMRQGRVAKLNALLGRQQDMSLATVNDIDTTFYMKTESDLLRKAVAFRQELKAIEAVTQKANLEVKLARKSYWPDVSLSAMYTTIPRGRTLAIDDGKNPWGIEVAINLPIWRRKYKAAIEEAKAAGRAHHLHRNNIKNEVMAEVSEAYARLQAAEQSVVLYRNRLIPDAEQSLQSSLSSYQTGTLDFLALLDSERTLLQFRLSYTKELAEYRQQIAQIERAVGR